MLGGAFEIGLIWWGLGAFPRAHSHTAGLIHPFHTYRRTSPTPRAPPREAVASGSSQRQQQQQPAAAAAVAPAAEFENRVC